MRTGLNRYLADAVPRRERPLLPKADVNPRVPSNLKRSGVGVDSYLANAFRQMKQVDMEEYTQGQIDPEHGKPREMKDYIISAIQSVVLNRNRWIGFYIAVAPITSTASSSKTENTPSRSSLYEAV